MASIDDQVVIARINFRQAVLVALIGALAGVVTTLLSTRAVDSVRKDTAVRTEEPSNQARADFDPVTKGLIDAQAQLKTLSEENQTLRSRLSPTERSQTAVNPVAEHWKLTEGAWSGDQAGLDPSAHVRSQVFDQHGRADTKIDDRLTGITDVVIITTWVGLLSSAHAN